MPKCVTKRVERLERQSAERRATANPIPIKVYVDDLQAVSVQSSATLSLLASADKSGAFSLYSKHSIAEHKTILESSIHPNWLVANYGNVLRKQTDENLQKAIITCKSNYVT